MHAVISLLLQSRKFWWYLLLTSSMLLRDVIMTSRCCQRYAECLVRTLFQQDSALAHRAPAHRAAHVQQLTAASTNARLSDIQPVASKQPRSQSCGLRDLGCHAASCLPQTKSIVWMNWNGGSLMQSWTGNFWWDYQWWERHRACVHAKEGHFEYSLWTDNVDFVHICYIQCDLTITSASNVGQYILVMGARSA